MLHTEQRALVTALKTQTSLIHVHVSVFIRLLAFLIVDVQLIASTNRENILML